VVACGAVLLLLATGALGAAAGSSAARIRPIYEVLEYELPDLHDGSVADWKRLLPGPTLVSSDFVQIRPEETLTSPAPPDLDVSVYLAWSRSGRVYAGFEVLDDSYYVGNAEWRMTKDCLHFLIDGDQSGGQYVFPYDDWGCEADGSTPECQARWDNMRQAQDYTAAVVPEGGAIELNTLRTWVIDPAYTVVGGGAMEGDRTGWVLELMVTPFDDLQRDGEGPEQSSVASTLVAGNLIGIYIYVFDRDAGDGLTDMRWYALDQAWPDLAGYSDSFSLFELMPAEDRPTAVPAGTWGEAKTADGASSCRPGPAR